MTFVIYHLSALVTANKDRELEEGSAKKCGAVPDSCGDMAT